MICRWRNHPDCTSIRITLTKALPFSVVKSHIVMLVEVGMISPTTEVFEIEVEVDVRIKCPLVSLTVPQVLGVAQFSRRGM